LVFDDVREISEGLTGAELLTQLVVDLRANGHVVLTGPSRRPACRAGQHDLLIRALHQAIIKGLIEQATDPTTERCLELFRKAADGFEALGANLGVVNAMAEVGFWFHIQRHTAGLLEVFRTVKWPDNPGTLVSSLFLRTGCEFVCAGWAASRPEAKPTAEWLLDTLGDPARQRFRDWTTRPIEAVTTAAKEILAAVVEGEWLHVEWQCHEMLEDLGGPVDELTEMLERRLSES
jgi:hypothetical protein